ncbi:MAG: restriction endonuclease [Bacteroidetes bacterium]|nr:MAG: restriction endonuclease [Bacteroidota bacterium]
MIQTFAEIDISQNGNYLKLLSAITKLSKLFSTSTIPYLEYRVMENIFCLSFGAENLSRSDSAFDADYHKLGVGLKTFICETDISTEKIAEFNKLSSQLKDLTGKALALKLAEFRNERIELAKRLYGITDSLYHIIARRKGELVLFETDYDLIDTNHIKLLSGGKTSFLFEDGKNIYSFSPSKSTLYRKFVVPNKIHRLPIEIVENPYDIILSIFEEHKSTILSPAPLQKGKDYVVLPLYGVKKGGKFVFEKSGLNQWNAGGRERNMGEVYIPVPKEIHDKYPDFFPPRDQEFSLQVPTSEVFSAKLCQDASKALMTNPNKALSNWLLRKVLNLAEGELATIEKLEELGFDSVYITKTAPNFYKIDKAGIDEYEVFIA